MRLISGIILKEFQCCFANTSIIINRFVITQKKKKDIFNRLILLIEISFGNSRKFYVTSIPVNYSNQK